MTSRAVAAGSPRVRAATAVPMSFTPSSTTTQCTPGTASTSRSKRASALGPRPSRSRRLPPRPWFSTATFAVAELPRNRWASRFGQRSFLFVVEPRPSVIESPSTTIADARASAHTSRPLSTYQWSTVTAPGRSAAPATFPAWRNDVVREPGWPVRAGGTDAKCTLTARFTNAVTSNATASDTICAPRGTVTEAAPSKLSAWSLAASMAAPPFDRATRTESTVRSPSPYAFERTTRSRVPSRDGWMTCRRVCPARPGAGGMFWGSVSCGAETQLPTQRPSAGAGGAGAAMGERAARIARMRAGKAPRMALILPASVRPQEAQQRFLEVRRHRDRRGLAQYAGRLAIRRQEGGAARTAGHVGLEVGADVRGQRPLEVLRQQLDARSAGDVGHGFTPVSAP